MHVGVYWMDDCDVPDDTSYGRDRPQCDIAGPYRGLVDSLWLLWELVLTAQPILVFTNSPARYALFI